MLHAEDFLRLIAHEPNICRSAHEASFVPVLCGSFTDRLNPNSALCVPRGLVRVLENPDVNVPALEAEVAHRTRLAVGGGCGALLEAAGDVKGFASATFPHRAVRVPAQVEETRRAMDLLTEFQIIPDRVRGSRPAPRP
jgi:hypothetical protein